MLQLLTLACIEAQFLISQLGICGVLMLYLNLKVYTLYIIYNYNYVLYFRVLFIWYEKNWRCNFVGPIYLYSDWGPLVDVVGYCFLNLASKYQPPEEFIQWIGKGSSPIYIGFGSMVCRLNLNKYNFDFWSQNWVIFWYWIVGCNVV